MEAEHPLSHSQETAHPLWVTVSLHLKNMRVYTPNLVVEAINYPLQLGLTLLMWHTLLSGHPAPGIEWKDMVLYYALMLAFFRFVPFASVAYKMADVIYTGQLVTYLVRPYRVWWIPFSEILARSVLALCICTPMIVVLLFIQPQVAWLQLLVFLIMYLLGAFMQFWFYLAAGLLAFWLEKVNGVIFGLSLTVSLLAGSLLPLHVFPGWYQQFMWYTPFPYFIYLPLHSLTSNQLPTVQQIVMACVWSAVICALTHQVLRLGLKKFTGNGV